MPNVDEKINNLTDLWSQLRRLARLHGEYLRLVMMEKLIVLLAVNVLHFVPQVHSAKKLRSQRVFP